MFSTIRAWRLLVGVAVGGINRDQQVIIRFLQEENRLSREHLEQTRSRVNDELRGRLVAGKRTVMTFPHQ